MPIDLSQEISAEAVRLTRELIRIPSESSGSAGDNPPYEAGITAVLQDICTAANIPWRLQEVLPKRHNFIASLANPDAPKILLLAHMDTVSTQGMPEPFSAKIKDGTIWGRGACDDKGPLAVLFATIIGLKRANITLKYDLTLVATVDEENSMAGSAKLAKESDTSWDLCLALEPSQLRAITCHIGVYRCRILPKKSQENPQPLEKIIAGLTNFKKEITGPSNPLLGRAAMTVTEIKNDSGPDRILVDIRLLPDQSPAKIHAAIVKLTADYGRVIPLFTGLGIDSAPDEPLIHAFRDSIEFQGVNSEPIGVLFPSDCSQLRNHGPCLVWGPGNPDLAHTPNEQIAIDQIEGACRVLCSFLSQN